MTTGITPLRFASFADAPGGGNPAGIVLDATGLAEGQMIAIAADLGYPETAFVVEPALGGDPRHVRVRYFSPEDEVPFCGHANIALGVVLAERVGAGDFLFETAVGPVAIATADVGGKVTASFTSVEPAVREFDDATADRLLGLLGLERTDLDERWPLREAFAGNWHPVVAIRDRETFDSFTFDPGAVAALMAERGWTGTVTVVNRQPDPLFVEARNIFPVGAITEDPATGSAAAALGAYLRELGLLEPPATFAVLQGRHVGRPSRLLVDVPPSGGITVTGTADRLNSRGVACPRRARSAIMDFLTDRSLIPPDVDVRSAHARGLSRRRRAHPGGSVRRCTRRSPAR